MSEVTRLLQAIESGQSQATAELLPLVYSELRQLAAAKLAHEKPGQTLQATALVHEAYLRLIGDGHDGHSWQSRGHFFAAAAQAMRRILIDGARAKGRQKRQADRGRFDIDTIDVAVHASPDQLLAIDEALDKLEREDPAVFELVKLRYFAGFNVEEAAAALGISPATAYRYWNYARAWLHAELLGQDDS